MKNPIIYLCDLLFPPKCIYCGEVLKPGRRPMICDVCMKKVPLKGARCSKCGCEVLYDGKYPVCPTCKVAGRYYDFAYAPTLYLGKSQKAIKDFKYRYKAENAEPLSYFITKGLRRVGITNRIIDFAVSVPADSERERIRGFDTSGMLAKYSLRSLGIEYRKGAVRKIGKNKKQSGLSGQERIENVKGVYKVVGDFKDKRVLVVDDILTTGATASEISKMLKRAGAKYVFVVTAARSLKFEADGDVDDN